MNQRTLNQVVLFSGGADMFPGGPYYVEFVTTSSTGAAVAADSTPVVTMNHNGTDDSGFSITVTVADTGRYIGTGTVPSSYVPGDYVWASVAATIGGVAAKSVVDKFVVASPSYARVGKAQGGTSSTITLDASASATDNLYNDQTAFIYSGTGAGQTATILSYVGSTKVATVTPNWRTTPDSTSLYAILPASRADIGAVLGTVATSTTFPSLTQIATAVWDEINTGATHNLNNSTGKQLRTAGGGGTGAIYPVSGTVNLTAGTSTTATLDASASAVAQAYQWDVLNILTGTGAGQSRIITNYTTGRVASVSPAWTTTPDATSTFDITPTASVQVVSYVAGQDPATLVWTAGTRTLTGLPSIPANWLTAAGIAAGALNGKGDWLTTLGATAPTGWISSSVITANALVGKGDWLVSTDTRLNNLDAAISSRSTYSGGPVASVTAAVTLPAIPAGWITANGIASGALAGKGDWSTLTDAQAADRLLGRNIEGGADGGRTVAQAMAFLRNKWVIASGTLTVYAADDASTSWTATVTTSSGNPVTAIDPA